MNDNKQIDKYLKCLDVNVIEKRSRVRDINPEATFEEIFESGEFDIDEMSELCGR